MLHLLQLAFNSLFLIARKLGFILQFHAVRLLWLLALTAGGRTPLQFQLEDELTQNAIGTFLRHYRRCRIIRSQMPACLFVTPYNLIEHDLMRFLKAVLRIVTNQRHLLATVLNVLVYESQPGTILLC